MRLYHAHRARQGASRRRRGEAPIGAVVVDPATGEVIAEAGNAPIGLYDPTAHAEILALRAAAEGSATTA